MMARLAMLKPRLATVSTAIAAPMPKVADSIYSTAEYREWREAIIARANGKCEDPECKAHHFPGQRLFADHIVELKDGGAPFDLSNGMARCGSSHSLKTAKMRAERMLKR